MIATAQPGRVASQREMAQLAQALASGVLQGDELRSILEAMPVLAEGLAKELGVSIGELRWLGSEGRLTAERGFPALLRATERGALARRLPGVEVHLLRPDVTAVRMGAH